MADASQSIKIYKQSVQANDTNVFGDALLLGSLRTGGLLAPWGHRYRDQQLRYADVALQNTMWQSAKTTLIKKVASTPWEISGGGKILTRKFQDILQNANFGMAVGGWRGFILRLGSDYLTQDFGAVIEIIGRGRPDRPIVGAPTGIAHLDSYRCQANPDMDPIERLKFPVLYHAENGSIHKMHYTRVARLVDMPSPISRYQGLGLCALSRAIGIVNQQIMMDKYNNERMDNLPPTGLVVANNVRDFEGAITSYSAQQRQRNPADGNIWQGLMRLQGIEPGKPVSVVFIPFSNVPEHFNYKEYNSEHAIMIAAAIGIDVQDLRPLDGGKLGTATQSAILHAKGRGRAFGDLLSALERIINIHILPPALEFKFKHRDEDQDKQMAETAKVWLDLTASTSDLTTEEKRQLLVNQVPAIADVLLDEEGQVRLYDDDVEPEDQTVTVADDTPLTDETEEKPETAFTDTDTPPEEKSYADTRDTFETRVADLIGTVSKDKDKRRFGIAMRRLLRQQGTQAMLDGLADGGVEVDDLNQDEERTFKRWLADQSGFVTNLGREATKEGFAADVHNRATMWANKSLEPIYRQGLLSADANGMYEWVLGATEEHCKTCLRMNGQIHRLKSYDDKGITPKSDKLECGGWRCDCGLRRTTSRARGRF